MKPDQTLLMRADQGATGASVHKLRSLSASYSAACQLHEREPTPEREQRCRRTTKALEFALAGLGEVEARRLAREEYPDACDFKVGDRVYAAWISFQNEVEVQDAVVARVGPREITVEDSGLAFHCRRRFNRYRDSPLLAPTREEALRRLRDALEKKIRNEEENLGRKRAEVAAVSEALLDAVIGAAR